MKKVLVLEDESSIRSFVVINLRRSGYEPIEAATGEEAFEQIKKHPDIKVALLDIMLPDTDGFEVCRHIRASGSKMGIIMLTARTQEMDKVTGLMTGADDYVTKPFSPAELTARIDALYRRVGGDEEEENGEIVRGIFRLNTRNRSLEKNGERIKLTQVEYSIVKLFMDNPGKALAREEILNAVWGRDYLGEVKIVDVNIRRLRIKIEDDPTNPSYITKTYAEYYQSAYKYTEKFDERDKLELQFINTRGSVEISTYGITAGTSPGTPDISDAIRSKEVRTWMGKSPTTGERIIAVSSPMIYSNGQVVGVMRYVSSLRDIDRHVVLSVLGAVAIGALILAFVFIMNMIFIRSIVRPVQEITGVARRIADGGYGVKIESKYEDEMGELTDAINEMSLAISRSDKMKTEFISSVSHELRTPLTAITGWGETLMYDTDMSEDSQKGISIILKEARRLTRLVEELLEFTRMADGRFTVNVTEIDIEAELEEATFTYGELLRQEGMQLEYEPAPEPLPVISADPQRLKQVFLNVLDNAAKYGRDGGRIIVTIGSEKAGDTELRDYAKITVRDFGPGIPEDELPHVKDRFYKGSSKERGSGIGLAVCDEIVRLHDGVLKIENAQGGGTLVTVLLPINNQ